MRTFMRYPGGRIKALTFSFDDGLEADRPLIDIFRKYGLKGAFNINTYPLGMIPGVLTEDQAASLYLPDQEVAMHGHTHAFMELLKDEHRFFEILENRRRLENIFKMPIRGFALPWGTYAPDTPELLRKAGCAYNRTTNSTHGFGFPEDLMVWNPTMHFKDKERDAIRDSFLSGDVVAQSPYKRTPWVLYIWGHSCELSGDEWEEFDKYCASLAGRDEVWYATNIEIADCADAYERLIFTLDGSCVYNPSAHDIWFEYVKDYTDFRTVCVKSGETLRL
jgi:hypothetical protein